MSDQLEEAATPVRQEIFELAKNSPPAVAELLRSLGNGLLDPDLEVTRLGGEERKRRRQLRATEFHKIVGRPPGEFLGRARLAVAIRLVVLGDLDIEEIPDQVGLSRTVFFERIKERFGKTPLELRRGGDIGLTAEPLTEPRGALGPMAEIKVSDFDKGAIAGWMAAIVCELPHHLAINALKEASIDSPALFEALNERSRQEGRANARRGVELAELAVLSVEGSSSALGDLSQGLLVRGLARLGNARLLANDHQGAARKFHRAEAALEKVPAGQRAAVKGELLSYRGTLRLFERRFSEARDDLHRAAGLCRSTGQPKLEAFVWLQIANLNILSGDSAAARSPLLAARQIVEETLAEDRHLGLCLASQLAYAQAESGHADEALAILPEARELAAELGHQTAEIQADWIEATARATKGDWPAVEALLARAREGFMALRDIGHTAIVSLDLAMLYEEQGRSAEVVSLAADALPALEALRLPEASTALAMLRRAIEEGQIGRELMMEIRVLLNPAAGLTSSH